MQGRAKQNRNVCQVLASRFRIVGLYVPVQDTILFQVVCHGILRQEHCLQVNRGTDIFTLQVWHTSRMFAYPERPDKVLRGISPQIGTTCRVPVDGKERNMQGSHIL